MHPRYLVHVLVLSMVSLASTSVLGGCSKSSVRAEPPAQGEAPAAATLLTNVAANVAADVAPSENARAGDEMAAIASLGLGAKLEREAQSRLPDALKAEDVYAALEGAGFALTEKRQHVASVFGANFCMGAKGPDGMAFSVCEFANDEAARKGRSASLTKLAMVPNRQLLLRKKSVLTIRQPPTKTPATEAATAKAAEIFAAL